MEHHKNFPAMPCLKKITQITCVPVTKSSCNYRATSHHLIATLTCAPVANPLISSPTYIPATFPQFPAKLSVVHCCLCLPVMTITEFGPIHTWKQCSEWLSLSFKWLLAGEELEDIAICVSLLGLLFFKCGYAVQLAFAPGIRSLCKPDGFALTHAFLYPGYRANFKLMPGVNSVFACLHCFWSHQLHSKLCSNLICLRPSPVFPSAAFTLPPVDRQHYSWWSTILFLSGLFLACVHRSQFWNHCSFIIFALCTLRSSLQRENS